MSFKSRPNLWSRTPKPPSEVFNKGGISGPENVYTFIVLSNVAEHIGGVIAGIVSMVLISESWEAVVGVRNDTHKAWKRGGVSCLIHFCGFGGNTDILIIYECELSPCVILIYSSQVIV